MTAESSTNFPYRNSMFTMGYLRIIKPKVAGNVMRKVILSAKFSMRFIASGSPLEDFSESAGSMTVDMAITNTPRTTSTSVFENRSAATDPSSRYAAMNCETSAFIWYTPAPTAAGSMRRNTFLTPGFPQLKENLYPMSCLFRNGTWKKNWRRPPIITPIPSAIEGSEIRIPSPNPTVMIDILSSIGVHAEGMKTLNVLRIAWVSAARLMKSIYGNISRVRKMVSSSFPGTAAYFGRKNRKTGAMPITIPMQSMRKHSRRVKKLCTNSASSLFFPPST